MVCATTRGWRCLRGRVPAERLAAMRLIVTPGTILPWQAQARAASGQRSIRPGGKVFGTHTNNGTAGGPAAVGRARAADLAYRRAERISACAAGCACGIAWGGVDLGRILPLVRHGGGPGRGRGLDRGLQPPPQALLAGPGQPGGLRAVAGGKGRRVTAGQPLRGQTQKEAASPPLTFTRLPRPGGGTRRAGVRGRPSGVKPAAHRLRRRPCGPGLSAGDLYGPSGRKYGQAPACPQGAARPVTR